jgi:hypothetical protein
MKTFNKLCAIGALALMTLASNAGAAVIDPYLISGNNVFEDDSGEYVYRLTAGEDPTLLASYTVVSGEVKVGDLFLGFVDFPIINGVNIDAAGNELGALFLSELTDITDKGTSFTVGSSGVYSYDSATLTFSAASNDAWLALFAVDLATDGPVDLTGALALFYEDDKNNVDLFTQNFPTTLANVKDGAMVLAIAPTLLKSFNSPADNTEFDPNTKGGIPGVTQLGFFGLNSNILYENLSGNIGPQVNGSGNNLVTDLAFHPVQDDSQYSFNRVPEPASIALIGFGLMGLAASRSRKKIG